MADLAPAVASVLADDGTSAATQPFTGKAYAHLTQLTPVYFDPTSEKWKAGDADGNAARATCTAIVLNDAQAGQPVNLLSGGGMDPGCVVEVGKQYVVSHNSGKISPVDDLGPSDYVQYLFFADATDHVVLNVGAQGALVQIPPLPTTTTSTTTTTTTTT